VYEDIPLQTGFNGMEEEWQQYNRNVCK